MIRYQPAAFGVNVSGFQLVSAAQQDCPVPSDYPLFQRVRASVAGRFSIDRGKGASQEKNESLDTLRTPIAHQSFISR
jgi:hypothetical protein